jgi:hypothetical protein
MVENDKAKVKDKDIDAEMLTKFPWRVRTCAYNFENPGEHPGNPNLTVKEDSVALPDTRCIPNFDGIDLSGGSYTDSSGRMTWRLSNFVCAPEGGPAVDFPVSFVATPLSDKPAYITVKYVGLGPQPGDIAIDVFSWDAQGNPAPSTSFYWRCRLPFGTPIIYRQPPAT